MATVVTKKCPNCGAGLQLDPSAAQPYTVNCNFCRTTIAVYPPVKSAPGIPPAPRPQGPNVIVMDSAGAANAGRTVGCIIATATVVPILLALFGALGGPCVSYMNGRFSPWYFPASCDASDEIVVHGRTETRADAFFKGGSNCKIKLVDCDLTGPVIFKGGSNSELILDHSTIHVAKAVVDSESNSKVFLTNGSKVYTDGVVATGNMHMEVELEGGSIIESKGSIVRVVQSHGKTTAKEKSRISVGKPVIDGDYGELSLDDSTLTVADTALREGGRYATVKLTNGSKVTGGQTPLRGGDYVEITIDGSQVEGGAGAIFLQQYGKVRLSDNASVVAKGGDAIRLDVHSEVEVGSGCLVQAPKAAVRFKAYGKLRVSGGRLRGADAFFGEDYMRVTLMKATLEGRRTTGDHSQVEEE